jgi:hypothetical protein
MAKYRTNFKNFLIKKYASLEDAAKGLLQNTLHKVNDENQFMVSKVISPSTESKSYIQLGIRYNQHVFEFISFCIVNMELEKHMDMIVKRVTEQTSDNPDKKTLESLNSLKESIKSYDFVKGGEDVLNDLYKRLYIHLFYGDVTKNVLYVKALSYMIYLVEIGTKLFNTQEFSLPLFDKDQQMLPLMIFERPTINSIHTYTGENGVTVSNIEKGKNVISPGLYYSTNKGAYRPTKDMLLQKTLVDNLLLEYNERIIREAFYINQMNQDLVNYLKAKRDGGTLTSEVTKTVPYDNVCIEKYKTSNNILTGDKHDPINGKAVTNIVKALEDVVGGSTNTKYVMISTLHPNKNKINWRHGATETLELIKELTTI